MRPKGWVHRAPGALTPIYAHDIPRSLIAVRPSENRISRTRPGVQRTAARSGGEVGGVSQRGR
jgi:hypothetical protein